MIAEPKSLLPSTPGSHASMLLGHRAWADAWFTGAPPSCCAGTMADGAGLSTAAMDRMARDWDRLLRLERLALLHQAPHDLLGSIEWRAHALACLLVMLFERDSFSVQSVVGQRFFRAPISQIAPRQGRKRDPHAAGPYENRCQPPDP